MNGNNQSHKKIGIFGGSFDPVHLGHIGLARDAMEQVGLDKVVFIPARLQPFKLDKNPTPGDVRTEMLKLATEGTDGFEISDYELNSDGISYTYLTMRAMQQMYGQDVKLYFITGTDAFLKIDEWKNAEELLREYSYIIGTRPGYRQEELELCIENIRQKYETEIINIRNVQIDASSTEIRDLLEKQQPLIGLLPENVERYIRANGLYRNSSK